MQQDLAEQLRQYQICQMFTRIEPYSYVLELIKNNGSDEKRLVFEYPYHIHINGSAHDIEGTEIIFETSFETLSYEKAVSLLRSNSWNFRRPDKSLAIPDKLQKAFIIAGMLEITIVCEKVFFDE